MGRWRTGPGERAGDETEAEAERRTAARLDKVFPVFIEGDGGDALGVARNISEGGMFVETRNPEPIGTQVRITFPSGAGEMTAIAEVRYVCHLLGRLADGVSTRAAVRGMGVRFLYFETAGTTPPILQ
jgi:PilZ domain